MTFTTSDYQTCRVSIHERTLQVPSGFTVGAIITRPGRNYVHVTRNRDGATVLCPLTPASDEVLPVTEMRQALHEAMETQ